MQPLFPRTVLAVTFLAAVVAVPGRAAEYVVDQQDAQAADENPGTAEKPFKTLAKAAAVVKPGDTVTVKAGVYREVLEIKTSGTAEKRITFRAAPGERVIINGADEIKGWRKVSREEVRNNPNWDKIYVAEIGSATKALFQDDRPLRLSRFPKGAKRKYMSQGGDKTRLADPVNLTQPAGFWQGAILTVRDASSTNYDSGIITGYDPEKHELTVDKPRRAELEPGKDEYYVRNCVSIINEPGEWAIDTSVQPHRIFAWPVGDADPSACCMEAPQRSQRLVSWADGVSFVTIDGFEVAKGLGTGLGAWGSDEKRGRGVQVLNCIVRHNQGQGISIGYQDDCLVRRCIVSRNADNGIGYGYTKNSEISECESFGNCVDGIVVSWYSDGARVLRNYVHDQWGVSHPDAVQTYCGVTHLLVKDNLFMDSGQGFQCAHTHDSKLEGNIWTGSRGGTLNLSIQGGTYNRGRDTFTPCTNIEVRNNTLAYNAMNNMTIQRGFVVANNVCEFGYRQKDTDWQCDYNLYIKYREMSPRPAPATLGGKYAATNDTHSRIAYPKFRHAPASYRLVDGRKIDQCTPEKLYVRMSAGDFAVGDNLELNFDGRVRKVTEVGPDYIVIAPPLAKLNVYGWDCISNWKTSTDFRLDLRLADDSPGKGMGEGGTDVGSTVDIQAYQRGDFDGDGRRDLPPAPDVLQYEAHTWDE